MNRLTLHVPAGKRLIVYSNPLGSGSLVRLPLQPGGGEPSSPIIFPENTQTVRGPFMVLSRWELAYEGPVDYYIIDPYAPVIESADFPDVELVSAEETDAATIAASLAETQTALNAALAALRTVGILA